MGHRGRLFVVDTWVGILHGIRGKSEVLGCLLIMGAVRRMTVVVREVLDQNLLEMTASEYEEPVQALPADGADEAFGQRVRTRGEHRRLDDPGALGTEHLAEAGVELRVSVPHEEPDRLGALSQDKAEVASLLRDLRGPRNRSPAGPGRIGAAMVELVSEPTSKTAVPYDVTVTFANVGVSS